MVLVENIKIYVYLNLGMMIWNVSVKRDWWGSRHATPKYGTWHTDYFKMKEILGNGMYREDLPFSEVHHKTLWEVPSLCPSWALKIKEHTEESKWTGLDKFPSIYYTSLTPFEGEQSLPPLNMPFEILS